jgi:predicted AAA+ superfamily ATPase
MTASAQPEYRPRLVDGLLDQLIPQLSALLLVGPRAVGKTTTALRRARSQVRLDVPAEASAFRLDPDSVIRGLPEPVLIDEWQAVPEAFGAVKRAVDDDPRPGRFLLTGSAYGDVAGATAAGTGRIVRLRLLGMTVRELTGRLDRPPLLDRLAHGESTEPASERLDIRDYLDLALQSGFPDAAGLPARARQAWLEGYAAQLTTRDVSGVAGARDPVRLRRYLEAYALNSAGTAEAKTIYDAAGIDKKTAAAYERVLENLFVIESLPAWTSNRLKRLALAPKRYLLDAGLMAAILRVDAGAILQDADLLGRLLDTFVVSQLRGELEVCETRPRLYHLRQRDGTREIDLVAELGGGRVIAFEIKASAAISPHDARHLQWLRDELGQRFIAGVVLHTGPRTFVLGDRLSAIPVSAIWG